MGWLTAAELAAVLMEPVSYVEDLEKKGMPPRRRSGIKTFDLGELKCWIG